MPLGIPDPFTGTTDPTPTGSPAKGTHLYDIIGWKKGFRDTDVRTAAAIALAESGGNARAKHHNTNGTDDIGLMQVNSVHLRPGGLLSGMDVTQLENPYVNVAAARKIRETQGWRAWTTYNSGAYKRFLGQNPVIHVAAGETPDQTPGLNVKDATDAITAPVDAVADFVGLLGQSDTWFRVGKVAFGGLLLGMGALALILAGGKTVAKSKVVRTAASVVPAGKAAKVATAAAGAAS